MNLHRSLSSRADGTHRWWRMAVVALGTLILCSCRATRPGARSQALQDPPALPNSAFTGQPNESSMQPGADCTCEASPLPCQVHGQWKPPGVGCPWPPEEYLCDGGDQDRGVMVSPDWKLHGLDMQDTVAHYDTLDGRTLVEASNRVCLYAPRFGAVRTVTSVELNEQRSPVSGIESPTRLVQQDDVQQATTSLQRLQMGNDVGLRAAGIYKTKQTDGAMSTVQGTFAFQDAFLPFEDLRIIRFGIHQQSDKARLAEGVDAAITWTSDQAAQVELDGRKATEDVGDQSVEALFTVKDLRNSPKLRIIKVASSQMARPGDMIDFTLRFDNVGDQPLGNIVVADNLTPRLEYVPDSFQASVAVDFQPEENEGRSLMLRWEVKQPLEPGEGGIIRFRCKVR